MKISYDNEVDARYIKLAKNKVARTEKQTPWLFFDYNNRDEIIGIEILDARKNKPILFFEGNKLSSWSSTPITTTPNSLQQIFDESRSYDIDDVVVA